MDGTTGEAAAPADPAPASTAELARLWRTFRDLAALGGIHAVWAGRDVPRIAQELCDASLSLVGADAALATIDDASGGQVSSLRVSAGSPLGGDRAQALRQPRPEGELIPGPVPAATTTLALGDGGRLVVASARPGFPSAAERFLLRHLANEAIVAIDEHRLLASERRARAAAEAAARLMAHLQRATAELAAAPTEAAVADAFLRATREALPVRAGLVVTSAAGRVEVVAQADGGEDGERDGHARNGGEPWAGLLAEAAKTAEPSARGRISHVATTSHGTIVVLDLGPPAGARNAAALSLRGSLDAPDRDFLLALGNQAAQGLERARERLGLEASAAAGRAFIDVVSHELRTPITTMLGASTLARRMTPGDRRRDALLDDVVAESERLYRTVENLLVLSKVEHGSLDLMREPVVLLQAVRRAIELEQPRWPGASIEVDAPAALPPVAGERTAVEQVLMNLIGNAAKYGGARPELRVVVERTGDRLATRVLDRGPGFDVASAEALFALYYRSPDARSSAPGAGIGLYVCRALVEAMGGTIWARAREGGGSEFGFELAALESPAEPE